MIPLDSEVDEFLDNVSEVSRLIAGLKAGSLPPEYIDSKIEKRSQAAVQAKQKSNIEATQQPEETKAADAANKQAELLRKVEELKAKRQRKLKARQLYQSYVDSKHDQQHSYATDYSQWDLWCPSDEEDDMFNNLTPNSPEFRAMEKDINSRHARMVEQRQIAERQRQLGNAAIKAGQYSEALRCYELGLEAQRHNMTLHANAAIAALRLECFVTAQEHCDKVLHLAEVLYDTPNDPLCVKALQRRAAAHQGLTQHSKAVADLEAALAILPGDAEVQDQLDRARILLEEHKTAKKLEKMVKLQQAVQPVPTTSHMECNRKPMTSPPSESSPAASSSTTETAAAQSRTGDKLAATTAGYTASSSDPCLPSTISSNHNSKTEHCDSLQRVQRLLEALDWDGALVNKEAFDAAQGCRELLGLLQSPCTSLFFRSSGGLSVATKLVTRCRDPVIQALALQLFTASCSSATASENLSQQILSATLNLAGSDHEATATAALGLAYTASTHSRSRTRLCTQLLAQPKQQCVQEAPQNPAKRQQAVPGHLEQLWRLCCAPSAVTQTQQVLALLLLSNCMLVPPVRAAMVHLWHQSAQAGELLASVLGSSNLVHADRVCGLISNMCASTALRGQVADCPPVMQRLLQLATSITAPAHVSGLGVDHAAAVLGALCNLSLEQAAQQQIIDMAPQLLHHLVQLAAAGPFLLSVDSNLGTCFPSSTPAYCSPALTAAPRLPRRGHVSKDVTHATKHADADTSAAASAADNGLLAARAATLVSRIAKQAKGMQLLLACNTFSGLVGALALFRNSGPVVTDISGGNAADQQPTYPDHNKQAAAEWLAAAVRTLAVLVADTETIRKCSSCTADTAVKVSCQLLQDPKVADEVKGNTALVLKGFAVEGESRWHTQLLAADAVAALLAVARDGRGNASSRNAGIALAGLARAGDPFLERMRQLRGLEVLYKYVRP